MVILMKFPVKVLFILWSQNEQPNEPSNEKEHWHNEKGLSEKASEYIARMAY